MNGFKPTIGIEFDDKYIDAKNKLLKLIEALDKLTPMQKEHLAREFIVSMSMAASFEEFMNYMNNGGQR
mgnify:CR=1 FL=1